MKNEILRMRIAAARKTAGLSELEFANRLGVPVWAVEAVEHGLRCCDEEIDVENVIPKSEWDNLNRSLSGIFADSVLDGETSSQEDAESTFDDEFTCHFPVTISAEALMDELAELCEFILKADSDDIWRKHAIDRLQWALFKFRLYRERMIQLGRRPEAEALRLKMLELFKTMGLFSDD